MDQAIIEQARRTRDKRKLSIVPNWRVQLLEWLDRRPDDYEVGWF